MDHITNHVNDLFRHLSHLTSAQPSGGALVINECEKFFSNSNSEAEFCISKSFYGRTVVAVLRRE